MTALAEVLIVGVIWLGAMAAIFAPMWLEWIDDHRHKKARKPAVATKRTTSTTVECRTEYRESLTLADLEKFVEEARMAGVDPKAKIHVYDGTYETHLSVTQALDM